MSPEPNWNDTGLDRESMFKPEAMSFWLDHSPQYFMQSTVHEIREIIMKVELQMGFIRPNPSLPLDYSGRKTPEEVCESIQKYQDELKDIMNIIWEYSKTQPLNK